MHPAVRRFGSSTSPDRVVTSLVSTQQRAATASAAQTRTSTELATPSHRRMDLSAADMRFARSLLEKKKAYIVDCDGVIYHSNKLLPGAREFCWWLHSSQKRYVFLTNSSDKTPAEMCKKFARLGLDWVREDNIFTSAMATAKFLAAQKGGGARAFVIGEEALVAALTDKGIECVDEASAEMSVRRRRRRLYIYLWRRVG